MVTISEPLRRLRFARLHTVWFAVRPRLRDAFCLTRYLDCESTQPAPGFVRLEKYAQQVDLTRTSEEIFAACRENTQYEIRRAEKEEMQMMIETDREAFRELYDRFAQIKGASKLNPHRYPFSWAHWTVTKAVWEEEALVMHAYVADPESKRVSLVHSVSLWQETADAMRKKRISWANRFLHYRDFLHFKGQGFERYDFGLQGRRDGQHPLDHFKDSFGPRLVECSEYLSVPYWLMRSLAERRRVPKEGRVS